jgi:hypothetical protein
MTNYRADYLTPEALSGMPFKSLGRDAMIHERVTLVGIENISIGSHVRIDPDVILLATGPLTIGCYTHIAAAAVIANSRYVESLVAFDIWLAFFGISSFVSAMLGKPIGPAKVLNANERSRAKPRKTEDDEALRPRDRVVAIFF